MIVDLSAPPAEVEEPHTATNGFAPSEVDTPEPAAKGLNGEPHEESASGVAPGGLNPFNFLQVSEIGPNFGAQGHKWDGAVSDPAFATSPAAPDGRHTSNAGANDHIGQQWTEASHNVGAMPSKSPWGAAESKGWQADSLDPFGATAQKVDSWAAEVEESLSVSQDGPAGPVDPSAPLDAADAPGGGPIHSKAGHRGGGSWHRGGAPRGRGRGGSFRGGDNGYRGGEGAHRGGEGGHRGGEGGHRGVDGGHRGGEGGHRGGEGGFRGDTRGDGPW